MGPPDKRELLLKLMAAIDADLESATASQHSTQQGAVHDDARAEDDKDTRAIEQQYLARGLAQRVEELRDALAKLRALKVRDFGEDDPIALSALVTVVDGDA